MGYSEVKVGPGPPEPPHPLVEELKKIRILLEYESMRNSGSLVSELYHKLGHRTFFDNRYSADSSKHS